MSSSPCRSCDAGTSSSPCRSCDAGTSSSPCRSCDAGTSSSPSRSCDAGTSSSPSRSCDAGASSSPGTSCDAGISSSPGTSCDAETSSHPGTSCDAETSSSSGTSCAAVRIKQCQIYETFIVRVKYRPSSLPALVDQLDKDLLRMPLTLVVKSNCSCARFFEQHPTIIEDTEDERLQIFLDTVNRGFCKCFKSESDSPDSQRLSSKTWLHVAAAMGSQQLVELLVAQVKLDVNTPTSLYQFTALSLAVMQTKGDLVSWLCAQSDIDVNVKSKAEKHTPLVDAMLSEKFHIVSILTRAPGIDLNATNFRNETPLILAVRMNNARLVKHLLEAGADHSIPTTDGSLPVMLSVNSGHLVVREFIHAKVPLNSLNSRGESAVTLSVRNRALDILDLLISGGASPQANPALPALVLAADLGHLRTVVYLLDIGENPDQKDENSWTALHFACMNGFTMIAEVLLDRGADPNAVTSCHSTSLSLAAFHRQRAISELLLSYGCAVNTFDLDLDTPLHFAAFNGERDMVQNLLDNGALACVFNSAGATPLFNAVVSSSVEIVKLLLPHYTDLELHATSCGFMYEEFTYKIQLRYQVPRSVLWVAANQASLTLTTLLLFAGFNASAEEWIHGCDFPAGLVSDDMSDLRELLVDSASNPLSLLSLCRCTIRRLLGPGKQRLVNQLNALPRKVKNYIALRQL